MSSHQGRWAREKDEKTKITAKGIIKTMEIIEEKEFLVLDTKEKIRLDAVLTFNGKRHRKV